MTSYDRLDRRLTTWMAGNGLRLLRWSLGIVFLWFGALKFFPGLSPADQLALATMDRLTFGLIPPDTARLLLALLEVAIGIGLITNRFIRLTLLALFGQMAGAVTPLFLFPDRIWVRPPFVLTLEGQYIIKNAILISAGLVIGATARGGRLTADPD